MSPLPIPVFRNRIKYKLNQFGRLPVGMSSFAMSNVY